MSLIIEFSAMKELERGWRSRCIWSRAEGGVSGDSALRLVAWRLFVVAADSCRHLCVHVRRLINVNGEYINGANLCII